MSKSSIFDGCGRPETGGYLLLHPWNSWLLFSRLPPIPVVLGDGVGIAGWQVDVDMIEDGGANLGSLAEDVGATSSLGESHMATYITYA